MSSLRIRTGWFHITDRIPLEPRERWANEQGCGFLPMVMSSCPAGLSSPWPLSQQALGLALSSLSSPAGLSVRVEPLWPSSAVHWTFKPQVCSGTVSSRNKASCWWQLLMRAVMPHTNKVITRQDSHQSARPNIFISDGDTCGSCRQQPLLLRC